MSTLQLYTYFRSTAAYRVRIALHLKGLDYQAVPVHLVRGEQHGDAFLAKNPQGLVPALTDGSATYSQSIAILEYLEEAYPEPTILPGNSTERARIRAVALSIACDIHPLNNLRVLKYLKGPLSQPQGAIDAWYAHWIHTGFRGIEPVVAKAGDGAHCFGSEITMADVCLVPQLYNARRFNVSLDDFPTIVAIDAALRQHEAFAQAAPDLQPDAE